MKDNNKRMNNQGRNNNHRNVTFVEHISDVIRRNSTIPQAVSGELRITNGDVEGIVTVNCGNAAYRNLETETRDKELKLLKEAESEEAVVVKPAKETQQDEKAKAAVALKELEAKYASSSFKEKLEGDFYNKKLSLEAKADKVEDILVDALIGLQLLKKFKEFTYSVRECVISIDGSLYREPIYMVITKMHVADEIAIGIKNMISDCRCLDVFTIKASEGGVRIIAGNLDGTIMRYDSREASTTSHKFIHDVLEANSPRA